MPPPCNSAAAASSPPSWAGWPSASFQGDMDWRVTGLNEDVGGILAAVVWVGFGALVLGKLLPHVTWQVVAYAALSLTVVRMVPVAIALAGSGARAPTIAFMGWFGPRGLASIVFTLIALESGVPDSRTLFATVGLTVLSASFCTACRRCHWWPPTAAGMRATRTSTQRSRGEAHQDVPAAASPGDRAHTAPPGRVRTRVRRRRDSPPPHGSGPARAAPGDARLALKVSAVVVILLATYYSFPRRGSRLALPCCAAIGCVVFIAILGWLVRRIAREICRSCVPSRSLPSSCRSSLSSSRVCITRCRTPRSLRSASRLPHRRPLFRHHDLLYRGPCDITPKADARASSSACRCCSTSCCWGRWSGSWSQRRAPGCLAGRARGVRIR